MMKNQEQRSGKLIREEEDEIEAEQMMRKKDEKKCVRSAILNFLFYFSREELGERRTETMILDVP